MGVADFVVAGFPKCGTTALMSLLDQLDDTSVTMMNGSLEAPFMMPEHPIDELRREVEASGSRFNGHKFVNYAYNENALKRISRELPDALVIICIRDPLRALVSWQNMHRAIAQRGKPETHFVNQSEESRQFYLDCSLSDYYRVFARRRLNYAKYVEGLVQILQGSRILVLSQSFLAANGDKVAATIADRIGTTFRPRSAATKPDSHVGFADRRGDVSLAPGIAAELGRYQSDIDELRIRLARMERVTLMW